MSPDIDKVVLKSVDVGKVAEAFFACVSCFRDSSVFCVDPDVLDVVLPFLFQHFGNPSSNYEMGQFTARAVEQSREHVATLLECLPSEIVFTASATESINHGLRGAAMAARRANSKHSKIVTVCTEHIAVLETCRYLESQGFSITYLPVDEFGIVNEETLLASIDPECTCLVSIMHANNETGTVQDIAVLCAAVKRIAPHVLFHTDASQSCGKMQVEIPKLGVDLLTIAAHKMYAPKNAGVLYIRDGIHIDKLIHGASQERGQRGGTENVVMVVGLGAACAIVKSHLGRIYHHLQKMRAFLYLQIVLELAKILNVDTTMIENTYIRINGHSVSHLPNTLSISFKNCSSVFLLKQLSGSVACSAGAACHSSPSDESATFTSHVDKSLSYVLAAMHIPVEYALGTLRLSVGKMTTSRECELAAQFIAVAVSQNLNQIN